MTASSRWTVPAQPVSPDGGCGLQRYSRTVKDPVRPRHATTVRMSARSQS
jgi:hypothetical protein